MHLAACDVIVGTFSSQVSRMAYEVSMVNNTAGTADRTFAYHSVDSMWYYGGQVGYDRCAAMDFTDKGNVIVRAGQQLQCPTVHEFDGATGYMKCKLTDSGLNVVLPPALVVDCDTNLLSSRYRPMLSESMRRPAAAAAAGTTEQDRGQSATR
jgi:hypothetical protein